MIMIIVTGVCTALLFLFPILLRHADKEDVSGLKEELKLPHGLIALGLIVSRQTEELRDRGRMHVRMNTALLKTKKQREAESVRTVVLMWLVLIAGAGSSLLLAVHAYTVGSVESVLRPAFGNEKSVTLRVEGLEDENEITFQVSGREPSEEEMEMIFDRQYEELRALWLNGNESFDKVRRSLSLSEPDGEIGAEFESSDRMTLSNRGIIVTEEIPEDGISLELTVRLSYKTYEKSYVIPVTVLPKTSGETADKDRLQRLISEKDRNTREKEVLELPETLEEQEIQYHEAVISPAAVFFLFLCLAVLVYAGAADKLTQDYKKRNTKLTDGLPGLLSRISTLVSAGLSIRGAWNRIIEDYQNRLKNGTTARDYIYEEMTITARQLAAGMSEGDAYQEFGKRCGLHAYVRLGNLLAKNLRQGISGLQEDLQVEMDAALSERKQQALRAGEEAGTKLLLPMLLMLVIVIVSLTVPAFMSF